MNCGYVIELLDLKGEKNTRMLKKKKALGKPIWRGFLPSLSIFSSEHYSVFRLHEMDLENVVFIQQAELKSQARVDTGQLVGIYDVRDLK